MASTTSVRQSQGKPSLPNVHPLSPTFFLPRAAMIAPNATAIVHTDIRGQRVELSYEEFSKRAMGMGYYLRSRKLSRVGILAPNTPGFLTAIYGISGAGGVNAAVNYRLKPDDIAYILNHADVEAVIVDREFEPLLSVYRQSHPNVPVIVDRDDAQATNCPFTQAVQEGLEINRQGGDLGWDGLSLHPETDFDLIAISYTSGTTAKPKGVEYLHRGTYLASIAHIGEFGLAGPTAPCRYLWTLPMFHAMGWCCAWAVTAAMGTHYTLRKIDYPLIWQLLKTEHISHFCAAPTVNTLLCSSPQAAPLPKPVCVIVAASPPTPHLFEHMTSLNLKPLHVYGMTETYGPITRCYRSAEWDKLPSKDAYELLARQGHSNLVSLAVRVIRVDESGEAGQQVVDVKRNGVEIGEIVFMGNICANGYYKDPEATRKLYAGGVLHTGDLAVWHPDGAIKIQDRAKDIIISGGENISSIALESVLATHPDILEVGVVAVADETWGERPKAYITLKKGRSLSPEDVIEWSKQAKDISRFMIPREVEILGELPKTSTGKIQKHVLRAWAKNGASKL